VLGDNRYAMLLVHDFFKTFIDKPIAKASTEVLVCLSCDSKEQAPAGDHEQIIRAVRKPNP
jgi:uncharacterized protein